MNRLLKIPWLMALLANASGAEKVESQCLEMRLRNVRNELQEKVKKDGVKSLVRQPGPGDFVVPSGGAAEFFQKSGWRVIATVLPDGTVGDVILGIDFSKKPDGRWDLEFLHDSQAIRRIFDSIEAKKILKRGRQGDLTISYGYVGTGGFTDTRGSIRYPVFQVDLGFSDLKGEGHRNVGYLDLCLASGLDPVDATSHWEWNAKSQKVVGGPLKKASGRIVAPFPEEADFFTKPRLHDARTGKSIPGFRIDRQSDHADAKRK